MSAILLAGAAAADGDTGPEITPPGEGRMVREDCGRQVHRLFHVERRSKAEIARQVDELVCLHAPFGFMAVGGYYRDFGQVEDAEVVEMLKDSRGGNNG